MLLVFYHRTMIHNMYIMIISFISDETLCPCKCETPLQLFLNRSREDLSQELQPILIKLQNELRVNKTSLSSRRRRRTSAKDNRKSSQAIGWFGAGFIVLIVFLVTLVDVVNLLQFMNIIHI